MQRFLNCIERVKNELSIIEKLSATAKTEEDWEKIRTLLRSHAIRVLSGCIDILDKKIKDLRERENDLGR